MKKFLFAFFVLTNILILTNCTSNDFESLSNEAIVSKQFQIDPDFKFFHLIDSNSKIQKKYDELRNFEYYEIPLLEKDRLLIGVLDDQIKKIKPVLFISEVDEKIILSNVANNRPAMELTIRNNSIYNIRNFKDGSFDIGSRCLGGSTGACIEIAIGSCLGDAVCAVACAAVFQSCIGSIAAACIISCW